MTLAVWLIAAVAFIAIGLDIYFSERAYAKGAIEADETLRDLFGDRPKAWQLAIENTVWAAPLIVALFWTDYRMQSFGVAWGAVVAIKHLIGANKARKLA